MKFSKLKSWALGNQLLVFIIGSVLIAIVITAVSMGLYQSSGAAKLDLSRPGYESVRSEVDDDNSSTKAFSPTGNLDAAAIKDFRSRYEAIKNKLDKTNNYDEADIDDDNLGLTVNSEGNQLTDQQ